MTVESYFVRGILIGLIFGVPAGVIGVMTIQRTLEKGFAAGLFTGLGSMAADCVYGFVGVCGLTAVSDFLLGLQRPIRLFGGALILIFGLMTLKKAKEARPDMEDRRKADGRAEGLPMLFASAFAVAILNPATILAFLTAFASFGILEGVNAAEGCRLLCGIAMGTGVWWLLLAGTVSVFRGRVTGRIYGTMHGILGILLLLFGMGAAAGAVIG
ncbi:MAG: LysE family transporter [Eubacteriales bacterium]|nr:LysE family transporter [Eubacteriales bacterium]